MALRVDDVDLVRDRALVERFQEGDPGAFETLYARYFARLTRFCQKRVGDPHEAEEIAQEAFVRALRALPTFEGERRFYPWMTVIAGRLCVDSHRRRGRSEPSACVDLGVIEGGQERIVDAVDVEILSTALGRIAPRHREVLDLREQQGWSYQQIADHYGVTLGTVEALLFRARKALRREFMAVVGGDRNWAAVPVFGLVLRRLASWKARLEAWSAAASLPTLSGAAVATALAVTAVTGAVGVGVGVLHGQSGDGRSSAPSAVVRMGDLSEASVTTSMTELLLNPRTADRTAAQAPERSSGGNQPSNPTPEAAIEGAVESVDEHDYDGGNKVSAEDPIRVEQVPGVYATLQPENAREDLTETSVEYVDQLGDRR